MTRCFLQKPPSETLICSVAHFAQINKRPFFVSRHFHKVSAFFNKEWPSLCAAARCGSFYNTIQADFFLRHFKLSQSKPYGFASSPEGGASPQLSVHAKKAPPFGGAGIAQRCLRGFFCRFPSKRKSAGPEGPADLFFFTRRLR